MHSSKEERRRRVVARNLVLAILGGRWLWEALGRCRGQILGGFCWVGVGLRWVYAVARCWYFSVEPWWTVNAQQRAGAAAARGCGKVCFSEFGAAGGSGRG